jgi:ElaB/YqjD/DUF883 family membrane-anchored ribosome-binding protein
MNLRDSLSGNFVNRIDELKSDIAALSEDLRKRVVPSAATTAGSGAALLGNLGIGKLLTSLDEVLQTVLNAGGGVARDARRRSDHAFRAVERTVEHNPVPAVATALAVGFLLGWICRPRR